jgi:hypothetical protein
MVHDQNKKTRMSFTPPICILVIVDTIHIVFHRNAITPDHINRTSVLPPGVVQWGCVGVWDIFENICFTVQIDLSSVILAI